MIMGPDRDKKSVAALIVSRMKPNGQSEDVAPGEDSSISEGERSAGEEILQAMEAKDVVGLVMAMRNLMEVMSPGEPEAEPEEPRSGFTE